MQFRLLGPLEVVLDGEPVRIGRRKQRALLGLLLLRANQPVPAERLIEELWAGEPPAQPALSLQSYVSNLRRVLEPARSPGSEGVLALRPGGYVLAVDPERIDARRFERLVDQARAATAEGDEARAEELYEEALALWRGDVLADHADDLPPQPTIARLTDLRLAAIEERIDVGLSRGRHGELVAALDELVMRHPLRERFREQYALALYRSGRQADALAHLREVRALLRDELGLDPGLALRRLEQLILNQSPELDWRPRETTALGARAGRGRIVGRERELELLDRVWQDTVAGRGRLVLIGGEPGIGKTRLAEELAQHITRCGSKIYWGRCFEAAGAPTFWPWVQVLTAMVRDVDAAELERLLGPRAANVARLVPEIGKRIDGLDMTPGVDPAEARFRLYDGVSRALLRLSHTRPIAVVLDDLHWADAPSLELLRLLAARLGESRILVIGTYRDAQADRGEALTAALADLTRTAPLERIGLTGLSVSGVAELLDEHLGVAASGAMAEQLHARTEGNPFFLSEVVRLLGAAAHDAGSIPEEVWREVPDGVREVIGRRVSQLPAESRRVLDVAAVVGRDFAIPTLARALGADPVALLDALEPAAAAGLVLPVDAAPQLRRFAHALVRETIYESLSQARRATTHGAVGTALDELDDDLRLSEVAHHFEQAVAIGYAERAIDASLKAADHAQRTFAFEQADGHLRRALRILEHHPDARREVVAQSRLAAMLVMTQGYTSPELPRVAERVRALAPRAGDMPEVADVTWALWTYTCVRAEFGPALVIADELIERGRRTGDRAGMAAGLQARGTTLWHLGRIAEAVEALQGAIAAAGELDETEFRRRSLQHPALVARTHASHALWLRGDEAGAERVIREARALADSVGTPYERAFSRYLSGWHGVVTRDFHVAERWCREALALTREHGFRQLRAFAEIMLGAAEAHTGQGPAGVARIREGLDAFSASGSRMLGHFHQALLADALLAAGAPDEAHAALEQALAESRSTGETFYLAEVLRLMAECLLAAGGDPDEARGWASRALDVARDQGAHIIAARAEETLARLSLAVGSEPV